MSNTSIVITSTRPDTSIGWLQANTTDTTNFTDEEYQNVILPYYQWIESLTGFQSITVTFPDELTKQTRYTFDNTTQDNANSAWILIHGGEGQGNVNQHPLARQAQTLLRTRSAEIAPSRANTFGTLSFDFTN